MSRHSPQSSEKGRRLARKVVYENPWVNLYIDSVEFPNGRLVPEYHLLSFRNPAVAAVIQNEQGDILFVRTYRYPTDSVQWEVPAGGVEDGESVIEAARREALEETGYETAEHRLIYRYHPSNGISNQTFHIVHCRPGRNTGTFDQGEIDEIRWFPLSEVREMLRENRIRDGFTLSALLLVLSGLAGPP